MNSEPIGSLFLELLHFAGTRFDLAPRRQPAEATAMKTFAVYLHGRDQPVEVQADWFALVGEKGDQSYRFKVKTAEGSEVIGEAPAHNLLLIMEKDALA